MNRRIDYEKLCNAAKKIAETVPAEMEKEMKDVVWAVERPYDYACMVAAESALEQHVLPKGTEIPDKLVLGLYEEFANRDEFPDWETRMNGAGEMLDEYIGHHPDCGLVNEDNMEGILIAGHVGTWYSVGEECRKGKTLYLLEHEEYGDEAACLIVNDRFEVIMDDVWNGFDDLDELED